MNLHNAMHCSMNLRAKHSMNLRGRIRSIEEEYTHKTIGLRQTNPMRSQDFWEMFEATGDLELYSMYRTLKEYEAENPQEENNDV